MESKDNYQDYLFETYTKRRHCGKRKYSADIVIDHQTFTIVEGRSKKDADWFRRQACVALERLINIELKNKTGK